jgi:lysophospholipase L1-like esterase
MNTNQHSTTASTDTRTRNAARVVYLRVPHLGSVVALLIIIAAAAAAVDAGQDRGGASAAGGAWVTAWGTSPQALAEAGVTNATVRVIARVTIPGDAVRIRLDNSLSQDSVKIGRAFVGLRVQGALLAAGSNKPITFGQAADVILPPGGTVWSDPVSITVLAQQDLAISLFIPGSNVKPSQHTGAMVTSYRTADGGGDAAADENRTPFTATLTSTWWLKAIDVQSSSTPRSPGSIVAFGDSITDGTCTTVDAHDRWEDLLSVRLGLQHDAEIARPGGASAGLKAVVNEGIGGNTVTRQGLSPAPDSLPGIERVERDVLSHHGVTDVILFMGTNDIRRGASADAVEKGLTSIIERIKAKGIRVSAVTIIPRHNVPANGTNTGWNAEKTRIRNDVNQWIRTKAPVDEVIDFDKVIRDGADANLMAAPFNCGDGIHPSPAGYYALGRSIPLSLFAQRAPHK